MSFFERLFRRGLRTQYALGMSAYNEGRWSDAVSAFRRALRAAGASQDPLVGLARFYAAEASAHLARTALQDGDAVCALRWLHPAMEWNPHDVAVLFLAALAHAECADTESSARCLRTLLAQNPQDAHAHILAGAVAFACGRRDEAVQHLQAVRDTAPRVPPYLVHALDALAPQFDELDALLRDLGARRSTRRA